LFLWADKPSLCIDNLDGCIDIGIDKAIKTGSLAHAFQGCIPSKAPHHPEKQTDWEIVHSPGDPFQQIAPIPDQGKPGALRWPPQNPPTGVHTAAHPQEFA
jgi:hypothetical protein